MKLKGADSGKARKGIVFAIAGAVVILTAALVALYTMDMFASRARRAEVAARGAQVMPFDLEQTTHVFQKLEDGGLQKVVVKDRSNKKQIALIQAHLKEESERFRKGDFSDPAKIHGEDMPGLAELKAGAGQIDVRYAPLPDGAEIRYTTKDPKTAMVLHRWFDAQLSEHGHHATGH
jgi:hypothetical protein